MFMKTDIQCVPLATEPGISLIILTPLKILQRNLNRSTFVVCEMKRNVSVVRFKLRCIILISGMVRVSDYRYRGPGFDPRRYQIF